MLNLSAELLLYKRSNEFEFHNTIRVDFTVIGQVKEALFNQLHSFIGKSCSDY